MPRIDLLCSLIASLGFLPACGRTSAPTTPAEAHVLRYSGTVTQPVPGGAGSIVYKIAGAWTLDGKGALVAGADTVDLLDFRAYGISGTARITLRTRCVAIVGKDAWAESEIVTTSTPNFVVGSLGVTRLSLASGTPKGGGGPREAWYPVGDICADRPAAMPAFDMQNGVLTFP